MRPAARRLLAILLAAQILDPSPAGALPTDGSTLASDRGIAPGAGALPVSSVADSFTGSASYAIPIEVPPGTGGLTPRLELRYSSHQRADSWVGFGWSLGTSSIARSLKRGTPAYESDDVFQLDGQELVLSETVPGRYHTRRESFLRIEQESNGTWVVTSKDGTRRRYGVTANARIVAGQDAQGQDRVFQWLLAQEEDLHGNVVQYQYDRTDPGSAYPSEIRYTLRRCASPPCSPVAADQAGPLQSLSGSAANDRVIRFQLHPAARPDQPSGFLAGFEQRLTKRLQYVQVEAAGRLVRCYELLYTESADSFRTLLERVAVHGADGCTAPTPFVTSFSYRTNMGASPPKTGWDDPTPWQWPSGLPLVDDNTIVGPQDKGVRLVDVDGDGRPDLLKAFAIMSSADPQDWIPTFSSDSGVYLNQGNGFSSTKSPTHELPQGVTPEGVFPVAFAYGFAGLPRTVPTGLVALDLTGDGRADIAGALRHLNNDGTRTTWHLPDWYQGTGSTFAPVPTAGSDPYLVPFWATARMGWLQNPLTAAGIIGGNSRFADLDGDGLPELIVRGDEEHYAQPGLLCTEFVRTSFYFRNLGALAFQLALSYSTDLSFGCLQNTTVYSTAYQPCNTFQEECSRQTLYGRTFAVRDSPTDPWAWWIHRSYGTEDLDVNGDGLADIVSRTSFPVGESTPAITWINDGTAGYQQAPGWELPAALYQIGATSEFSRDLGARFADVNGDGRPDMVCWRDGAKNVWLNRGHAEGGSAWVPVSSWLLPSGEVFVDSEGRDRGLRLVDIDGDGMVDVVRSEGSTSRVYLNRGEVPDLLEQVTTPMGGTIQYGYTPSTQFDHRGGDDIPDLPAVLQLVTSIEIDDGTGAAPPIVTTFSDQNGRFDAEDRELRGFGSVSATRGDRHTVTAFHQTAALAGLVASERVTSAADPGICWSGVDHFYTPDASPPYVSLPTSQVRLEYDGSACDATPRRTRVDFFYGPGNQDPYGNLTQIIDYGEVDDLYLDAAPADTRLTQLVYASPNDGIYLVDRVRFRTSYTGPLGQPTLLSQTQFFYDDDTTGTAVPNLGRLTQRREVLAEPGKPNPTTITGYDTFGNVVSVRDPRHVAGQRGGAPTIYEYDTTFRTFRTASINAKGHRTEYRYSAAACAFDYPAGAGLVQDERGPNELLAGTRWLRCFDVHGRPVRELGPASLVESLWDYDDTPGAVSVTAQRRVQAGSYRSSTTFLDGLGRVSAEWTDGPQAKTVVESRLYDATGRLEHWTAPRLCTNPLVPGSCDAEQVTTFAYDPLDRLESETRPGNRVTSYERDRGWLSTTDANGNPHSVFHDAFGNVSVVHEYDGIQGQSPTLSETIYEYRADDQLEGVTDAHGNQTSIGYDLLGRRRSLTDPDTGFTQYDYDANGNLLVQTDAAGQTIHWTYDELDRPDVRRIGGPSGPIESDWDYDTAPGGIGALSRRTDGAGVYWRTAYDPVGRPLGERNDVAGRSFAFTNLYDGLGQRTNRWYPTLPGPKQVRFDYDARGYLTGTAGILSTNGVEWDAQGRLARWRTPAGATQTTSFDPVTGRLDEIRVADSSGLVLEELDYDFDPGDRITSITDVQDGALTNTFEYYRSDRLRHASGPGGGYYLYDSIGNLRCKTSSIASCFSHSVKLAMTYPTAGAPRPHAPLTVSFQPNGHGGMAVGHSATGNLETVGTRRYDYDDLGRLTAVRENQRLVAEYAYDAGGRRARSVDHTGPRVGATRHFLADDFEWDETRKLARIHVSLGSAGVATYVERLDPPTVPAATLLPAGPLGRPWQLGLAAAPALVAALLLLWQLASLHRRGHRRARPAVAGATALALYLGIAAPALAIPNGDLNRDGRFDAADILLAHRIATGSLSPTSEQLAHGDVAPLGGPPDQTIHGGDVVVLLRGLSNEDLDGDGVPAHVEIEHGASPFLFDTDGDGLSDAEEIALGTDPASADTDEDGIPDGQEVAGGTSPTSGVHYRYGDHLGSTILTTRADSGVIERAVYEPFGARIPAGTPAPRFGFTGQRYESGTGLKHGTGLYDYGARWYDPSIGRFLQPDPIVPGRNDPQGLNRYAYVRNNPVNRVDPTGHFSVSFFGGQYGNGGFSGFIASYSSAGRTVGATVYHQNQAVAGVSHILGPAGFTTAFLGDRTFLSAGPEVGRAMGMWGNSPVPDLPDDTFDASLGWGVAGGFGAVGAVLAGAAAAPAAYAALLNLVARYPAAAVLLERVGAHVVDDVATGGSGGGTAVAARGAAGLAERAAAAGARYPKQVEQALRMTPQQLQKSVSSFIETIAKHRGYLNNPSGHVLNWNQLSPQHQQSLIHHWNNDIARNQRYLDIAEGVLGGVLK